MAKLTKAQRSAAAKKGWRRRLGVLRSRNPYFIRSDSDSSTERVHTENLPHISLYKPHLVYGRRMTEPELSISSGQVKSRASLDEFISELRKAGDTLR